ncbi:hypothetical protein LSAT2_020098, partial [Lamellibrachia satsuma]
EKTAVVTTAVMPIAVAIVVAGVVFTSIVTAASMPVGVAADRTIRIQSKVTVVRSGINAT